jgi:methyl-accepting chemotaxis protein
MQYDAGQGYVFAYGMDGTTLTTADHKLIGGNSLDIVTNGRKLVREFRDAVRTSGEMVFRYEYARPGETQLSPKSLSRKSSQGLEILKIERI